MQSCSLAVMQSCRSATEIPVRRLVDRGGHAVCRYDWSEGLKVLGPDTLRASGFRLLRSLNLKVNADQVTFIRKDDH